MERVRSSHRGSLRFSTFVAQRSSTRRERPPSSYFDRQTHSNTFRRAQQHFERGVNVHECHRTRFVLRKKIETERIDRSFVTRFHVRTSAPELNHASPSNIFRISLVVSGFFSSPSPFVHHFDSPSNWADRRRGRNRSVAYHSSDLRRLRSKTFVHAAKREQDDCQRFEGLCQSFLEVNFFFWSKPIENWTTLTCIFF